MRQFNLVDREYPRLPELLVDHAPRFAGSPEYARLDPSDLQLPSVVCGAFARYFHRLQSRSSAGLSEALRQELQDVYRTIERLAKSSDPDVVNTVVVEVYEHLDLSPPELASFKAQLGPASRALYDEWIVEE